MGMMSILSLVKMASATKARDVSTTFLFVLLMIAAISGLPVADVDVGNTDGQILQPDGQQMFAANMAPPSNALNDPGSAPDILPPNKLPEPSSDDLAAQSNIGLSRNPPEEVLGVAGTGLAMMSGPVIPGGNTGALFPDNMPPPPAGAVNDEVPAQGQVVPKNNGGMFPDNMPLPPAGAVNDGVPAQGQVWPKNNGGMFPDNMPPPPFGAVNDEVPAEGQAVPGNNGGMFPINIPQALPNTFNDGILSSSAEQVKTPQENEVNQGNAEAPTDKETASPPYRGMFSPNMPPPPPGAFNEPPPGAFNEPPPVPEFSKQKADQAVPSDGAAVEPVYINGMNLPDSAAVPPSEQNPYIDPNNVQIPSLPSNQQNLATGNFQRNFPQFNPNTAVSNDPNAPYSQTAGDPQLPNPNTQNNLGEGQAPYNPDGLDAFNNPSQSGNNQPAGSVQNPNDGQVPYNPDDPDASQNSPVPVSVNNQQAESISNQNEAVAPIGQNVPEPNPNQPAEPVSDNNLPAGTDPQQIPSHSPSESINEPSRDSPYDGEQNEDSQWEYEESSFSEEVSESVEAIDSGLDYSFMDFFKSSEYESPDSFNEVEGAADSFWEESDSEAFSDTSYGEENSEYSNLEWLYNDGPSLDAVSESNEEDEEDDFFGRDRTQEIDEGQKQTIPYEYLDNPNSENDIYRTGGTKLVIYCIPVFILCVLILLAWKNYRGRIRVVGVHTVDKKEYDWRTDRKSEEHAPMLDDEDHEDRGY